MIQGYCLCQLLSRNVGNMKQFMIYLLVSILLSACVASQEAFVKHMADRENGPWQQLETDDFIYALQYRPISFQVLIQTQEKEAYDKLVTQGEGMEYYYLSILSKKDGFAFPAPGSPMRNSLESDFGFEAIRLEIGGKMLAPTEYYYEPSYNLRPEAGMLLAFKVGNATKDDQGRILLIKGPFDTVERSLNISETKINGIPDFKL